MNLTFYFPPKAGKHINGVFCVCVNVCASMCVPKNYEGSQRLKCQIFLDIVCERDISTYLGCYSLWTRFLKIFFDDFIFEDFLCPCIFKCGLSYMRLVLITKGGKGYRKTEQGLYTLPHCPGRGALGCTGVPVEFAQRISDLDRIHQEPG